MAFYPAAAASCPVRILPTLTLSDQGRSRSIPLRIYLPQQPGLAPVIIFSHGIGGTKDAFSYLSYHLASHGYLCIHPTHLDTDAAVLREKGLIEIRTYMDNPGLLSLRPRDITYIIDSLGEIGRRLFPWPGTLDRERIGVAGHSYGALVTVLLAGAALDLPDTPGDRLVDQRPGAFLAISPQGTGNGLTRESWRAIRRPLMTISGTRDVGWSVGPGTSSRDKKPPSWRLEAFIHSSPGNKYHLLLAGASHFSYGEENLAPRDSAATPVHSYIKTAVLAFWDAHLRHHPQALAFLRSDGLLRFSRGYASLFWK